MNSQSAQWESSQKTSTEARCGLLCKPEKGFPWRGLVRGPREGCKIIASIYHFPGACSVGLGRRTWLPGRVGPHLSLRGIIPVQHFTCQLVNPLICKTCVLICWGCHNKVPQSGQSKEQDICTSPFWRVGVGDWGASRSGSFRGCSPCPASGHLLPLSSPDPPMSFPLCLSVS